MKESAPSHARARTVGAAPRRWAGWFRMALASSLFWGAACGSSAKPGNPVDAASGGAGGEGGGGGNADAGPDAAGSGGGAGGAGGGAAGTGGRRGTGGSVVCGHELDNPSCWSAFDFSTFTNLGNSFFGAVFDGRYVTYVNGSTQPNNDSMVHYDTQGDWTAKASWSAFNVAPLGSGALGYRGAVFDGRYIYFIPTLPENNGAGGGTYSSLVLRYDTQASFATAASWTTFNLTTASGTADPTIPGFRGGAFDGRYVYFVPGMSGSTASGKAARYDTQAPFAMAASWTTFDVSGVHPDAKAFDGAAFDGRYLYFAPHQTTSARVARYDTQASFTAAASWSTFETTGVNQYAAGFTGAVFDGRHVYFAPASGEGSAIFHCVMTRYDSQAAFDAATSWEVFDTSALNTSSAWRFSGAAFDGHYVYFMPDIGDALLRYDPQGGAFGTATSWTAVRPVDVASSVSTFQGAAFDGRYLYPVPRDGGGRRFDARAAGPLPPSYRGSWY